MKTFISLEDISSDHIKQQLESLSGNNRLDASSIKNLSITEKGDLIWASDYDKYDSDSSGVPPWSDRHIPSPAAGQPAIGSRISVIDNLSLPGTGIYKPKGRALKTELFANDVLIDGGSARSEVLSRYATPWTTPYNQWPDPAGSIRWYSYSLLIPTEFNFTTDVSQWLIVTQLKGYNGGSPPISIGINKSQLRLSGTIVDGQGAVVPDTRVNITKGTWMRIILGVKLSTSNDGWVEWWVNNVNVLPRTSTKTMDIHNGNPDPIYLKQGIYRALTFKQDHILYFGSTKIADTKEAALKPDIHITSDEFSNYADKYRGTKITISSTEPTNPKVNDIWFDTNI